MSWLIFYLYMVLILSDSDQVILHEVRIPNQVLNGSLAFVVLDCIYSLEDVTEYDGLVVKWYKNDELIYQWIPPSKPRGVGRMRGMLNLDYAITPHIESSKYRALHLIRPSTVMTGDYRCKVSTMLNQVVSQPKTMIVYEPPHSIRLTQTPVLITTTMSTTTPGSNSYPNKFFPPKNESSDHSGSKRGGMTFETGRTPLSGLHYETHSYVNVTCAVQHVFPKSTITLYHAVNNHRIRLSNVNEFTSIETSSREANDKHFSQTVWINLPVESLTLSPSQFSARAKLSKTSTNYETSLFFCDVEIPNTRYAVRKTTYYTTNSVFMGRMAKKTTVDVDGNTRLKYKVYLGIDDDHSESTLSLLSSASHSTTKVSSMISAFLLSIISITVSVWLGNPSKIDKANYQISCKEI